MQNTLYESKSYPGQLMLYEGGESIHRHEIKDSRQANWWYKQMQLIQMKRLDKGLRELPYEKYFANNGKNYYYFAANKMANKAVRIKFGLSKTYKKKDMSPEMLKYRHVVMNQIIAGFLAKARGQIKHVSPLIYDNIVARVVENKTEIE